MRSQRSRCVLRRCPDQLSLFCLQNIPQASLAHDEGRFRWIGRRFIRSSDDLTELWTDVTQHGFGCAVRKLCLSRPSSQLISAPTTASTRRATVSTPRSSLASPCSTRMASRPRTVSVLGRIVKFRSSLVRQRSTHPAWIEAHLEIMGAGLAGCVRRRSTQHNSTPIFGLRIHRPEYGQAPRRVSPGTIFYRHSRGRWGEREATLVVDAAEEALRGQRRGGGYPVTWAMPGAEVMIPFRSSFSMRDCDPNQTRPKAFDLAEDLAEAACHRNSQGSDLALERHSTCSSSKTSPAHLASHRHRRPDRSLQPPPTRLAPPS